MQEASLLSLRLKNQNSQVTETTPFRWEGSKTEQTSEWLQYQSKIARAADLSKI